MTGHLVAPFCHYFKIKVHKLFTYQLKFKTIKNMLLSREMYNFFKNIGNNSKFILKNNSEKNIFTCAKYAAQVSFKLSDIGEGIREVVVKEWFIKEGDKVSQFDEICEVQSDKAAVTITSRYDGVVKKLHYKIDDIALVGEPLIDIETEDGNKGQLQSKLEIEDLPKNKEIKINTITDDLTPSTEILCIPSVRRLAKEHMIDLSQIRGSGKSGRILKEDILKFIEIPSEKTAQPSRDHNDDIKQPIKGFQKAMVKTMTDALKIPHFVYGDEIIITKLSKLRQTIKKLPKDQDLKLSYMPFFIKAASNALKRYPVLNSTLDEKCENVTYKQEHNFGVAMDTKAGLAVPVIKNVDKLSIMEISNELNRLIKFGRNGTFSPQDLTGGTFTISNIGAIGGIYMKPVILPPQVAIIAIGATQLLPRYDELNNVVPVEVINLSGAADHRIVDGATMARFVQVLKKQIENPYLLFLDL